MTGMHCIWRPESFCHKETVIQRNEVKGIMSWSTIGSLLVIVAGFAVSSMAFGFFKAAWSHRKEVKEADEQKQAEKAEKEEAEKAKKSKKQAKNKPKVKRLDK